MLVVVDFLVIFGLYFFIFFKGCFVVVGVGKVVVCMGFVVEYYYGILFEGLVLIMYGYEEDI